MSEITSPASSSPVNQHDRIGSRPHGKTSAASATTSPTLKPWPKIRRACLVLAAAAGLLALGAPIAAQASVQPKPQLAVRAPGGSLTSLAVHKAGPGLISRVGSNGASHAIGNCTFVVGDHSEANRYASGEADIKCPATYTYQVHVYLDYEWDGSWYTAKSWAASQYWPYPGTYWDVWTPGVCSTSGQPENLYWQTAAEISFNSGPTYGFYYSVPNYYQIPAC